MGTVVLHPGAGKAGSSSIQDWLALNAETLRDAGVCLLAAEPTGDNEPPRKPRLSAYESGSANANAFFLPGRPRQEQEELIEAFFEQLDAAASQHSLTVVSAEAMATLLSPVDEFLVEQLNRLADRHELRLPYYVRPQHTALEAWWRQWGFRDGRSPSRYIGEHAHALRYFDTYVAMREAASEVSFEPRPFRRDLLDGGDPAADFARRFLDVRGSARERLSVWSNPGLPLEVVNALRLAPPGLFWSSVQDNDRLDRLKELLAGVDATEDEDVAESRRLLQAYSRRTFEAGNAQLIEALGWGTEFFVPPVDGEAEADPELTTLDELWRPRITDAALRALGSGLGHGLSALLEREQALGEAMSAIEASSRDLSRVRSELEGLRESRSWRWSRRLVRATAALRGRAGSDDPTRAMQRRLEGASERFERLNPSPCPGPPPCEGGEL